ncbi:MAG: hypothetical protein V5783_08570 [Pontiella sp.]
MKKIRISKRISLTTYKVARNLVRLFSVVFILLIFSFVFLRLYGVPDPLLRHIIKRANEAGIPVDMDAVQLTLRGWKASNVTYYSGNPHDLGPLLQAREVFFSRKIDLGEQDSDGWKLDLAAVGIKIRPSVEWGVNIPEESESRFIESARLTLGFFPDRIECVDGEVSWIGIDFTMNGSFLKKEKDRAPFQEAQPPLESSQDLAIISSVLISAEKFKILEAHLQQLKILGKAQVNVSFSIVADNYSESVVEFSLFAEELSIHAVEFDRLEVIGAYEYPELEFEKFSAYRKGRSLELDGTYNFESKLIEANLNNSITSRELLSLAPQSILDLLVKIQLQFDELPEFSLKVGPEKATELLNAIEGKFLIKNVSYCKLLIESVGGNIRRSNNYLDLTELHATIRGQEERAEEVGSSLQGGAVTGRVFWDSYRETFGVEAEGSLDPNLFLQPLAIIPVATNAIGRFWFPEDAPDISIELGSNYTDRKTFFINVHGKGNQIGIHDGLLSSVNISAFYSNALLRIEPITVMSGVDFMKGTAEIDFRNSTVHFDIFGSLPPALLEDVTYADFNLFGQKVHTSGQTRIKAKGALDWKTMRATDFRAEVEAEHFTLPIAALDHFSAVVIGDGSHITVSNSVFGIYGGEGDGLFSIRLEPGETNMPYALEFNMKGADFKQCLEFVKLPTRERTKGLVSVQASIAADMRQKFFETANGNGRVAVKDGELADMPLFTGFSRLLRKVIPGFSTFSITSFDLDFALKQGEIYTDEATFEGDVFNAMASGKFSQRTGYDAIVQVQMMSDKGLQKVIRIITNPFFKLFRLHLSGPLTSPSWRLDNFTTNSSDENESNDSD